VWARTRFDSFGIASPFRRVLDANGSLWSTLFSPTRIPNLPASPPSGKAPRVNGKVGLDDEDFDASKWVLDIGGRKLSLAEIKKLKRTESTCLFKCIEGWSEDMAYAGVRFSDFAETYGLGKKPDGSFFSYAGLETPEGDYFVSIDQKSLWHPQTVLAYEMNGKLLTRDNGAPLRLMIPVKYGIKNLKCVGKIFFSDDRPRDYWQERGYDWFAGL
jgi:DMSO/TMAO reductase YedYZ molybdopterin-dependent catalytic subunit